MKKIFALKNSASEKISLSKVWSWFGISQLKLSLFNLTFLRTYGINIPPENSLKFEDW